MRARPLESFFGPLRLICLGIAVPGLFLCTNTARAHDGVEFPEVQTILAKHCGGAGCHMGEKTSGVDMTTYASLMASVGDLYGTPIVVPGDPDASPLLDKVENSSPRFGARMPSGLRALSASDRDHLRRWIRDGAVKSRFPPRGDLNDDGAVNVSDAVGVLFHLFRGGFDISCMPQADADANGTIEIADTIFVLTYLFLRGPAPIALTEAEWRSCQEQSDLSFDSIYEKVFAVSCAFSSCHSAEFAKGGLSLATRDDAYQNLVGTDPFNEAARSAGLKRVDPGKPDKSFLLKKLTEPGPGEGNRMPLNSPVPLSDPTVRALREWILAGAPKEGTIAGVPDITDEPPPPVDRMTRPPVPENGVQLHLPAFEVGTRRERQLHYFVGAPFADLGRDEIWVERIDVHMMEQSHHFILYEWIAASNPRPGYREGSNTDVNRLRLVLVAQQSFFSLTFPEGVSIKFDKNTRFDLNSHYVNINGQETLLGETYVNIFFADPDSTPTEARSIFDFGGNIFVPPNGTSSATGVFPNSTETRRMDPSLASSNGRVNKETHILALVGHTHRHGDRFEVFRRGANGQALEKVYDNFNWDDPEYIVYDPPLVLQPGEGLNYKATYTYHDPPSPSSPALRWGASSEDEMIILLGYYFVPEDVVPEDVVPGGGVPGGGVR